NSSTRTARLCAERPATMTVPPARAIARAIGRPVCPVAPVRRIARPSSRNRCKTSASDTRSAPQGGIQKDFGKLGDRLGHDRNFLWGENRRLYTRKISSQLVDTFHADDHASYPGKGGNVRHAQIHP